jgi:four helix bundle protein
MGHSYRDLVVWQRAKALSVETYMVTEAFPKTEIYGLTSQMRRAAVSVVSNIAEGQGRQTKGEFLQFLGNARGSLFELETQFEIALELRYISDSDHKKTSEKIAEVRRPLLGLMDSLRAKSKGASA